MIIVGDKITKISAQRSDKGSIGKIESKPEIIRFEERLLRYYFEISHRNGRNVSAYIFGV